MAWEEAINPIDVCPVACRELAAALRSAVAGQLLAVANPCRSANERVRLGTQCVPVADFAQNPRKRNTSGHKLLWSVC
jgi:hypothetical protein